MKQIIVIVVLVAAVQMMPAVPHGPSAPINEDCIRETGVKRTQLKNFGIDKLEASRELRCYRRCADIKDGRLLENNMPNTESPQMLSKLPPGTDVSVIKNAANECQSETAAVAEPCDNWLAMLKCVSKKFGH